MAIFPQGLSQIDARCNAGERRVLQQLSRCLEDDYLVWHDIPIGPQARQPDFVILSPRWGVLLLEVKDWKLASLHRATRDAVELNTPRGRTTVPHPLRQARDHVLELVDLMRADPTLVHADGPFSGRLLFPYGWGMVFSNLRRAQVAGLDFDELFPAARTLLRDDLDGDAEPMAFQHRLWGMFTLTFPCTLTLPQRDRIRWHLFPELRITPQAELPLQPEVEATALPDLMQVMDLQQEQLARTLGEGHRVIHGAAGSGKTMILVFRAAFLAAVVKPTQPVLVLCFNRTLAQRIETLLRARGVDERVQVRTFHGWCQDLVRSYQLEMPQGLRGTERFEALAATVERAVERGRVPGGQYHSLLIDEAHDFDDAWLRIAARMVSPATRNLLVLYDDTQSIYQPRRRRFNFASVGIEARGRTSVLRLNYRNTAEVLAVAVQVAQGLLRSGGGGDLEAVQPASAGRRGPLPVLLQADHARQEAEWVAERAAAAVAAGLAPEEIALVCRTRAMLAPFERALRERSLPVRSMGGDGADGRFDTRGPGIKLLTMHSVKGLEFSLVFVGGLQVLPFRGEPLDEALRLLYVAMTRATRELVLSAHGRGELVARVQAALGEVARHLAGAVQEPL